jgi:subtilase family serine protease
VVISATVHNLGDLAVSGGQVALYDGDPGSGGTQIGLAQALVSPLPAATTGLVSVEWNVPAVAASHAIYAVVDPAGSVDESDEGNNEAWRTVVMPDLAVAWAHSTHSTDTITLTASISNVGHVAVAPPPSVAFRAGDPVTGTLLGIVDADGILDAGQQVTVSLELDDPGSLVGVGDIFWAVADPGQDVEEADETNNADLGALAILPDLTLSAADISATDPFPVTVHNRGLITATGVVLAVRVGGLTGTLVFSGTLGGLVPGASSAVTLALPPGPVELWAQIDPDDRIVESDEGNNLAVRELWVSSYIYLPLVVRDAQ